MKLRLLITTIFVLLSQAGAFAQGFSYLYIQGDKKTPIYTKVEGVMMPRHGKNYALISRLAPGPLNVEILFQQNEYPPVQFNIMIPENGKRAFILDKKEGEFTLFDIQQSFYLKANNDINDDHLPTVITSASAASNPTLVNSTTTDEKQEATPVTEEKPITSTDPAETKPAEDSSKPKFIDNITFDNDPNSTAVSTTEQAVENGTTENPATTTITNSDCTGNITAVNFQKMMNSINAKKTEDERLGIILESTKKNCFSTSQSKLLLQKLDSDIAKFGASKKLYPKVTDQVNFAELENLFSADDWKESFRTLLQPK
ncbi:MAG: DUF4476 domain-containing protein [Chitinophagaceae bacterium]